ARAASALRLPGRPPPPPAAEARVSGRLHSQSRDRAVISHHYDVPAEFYELILDPSMAYSSGLWDRAGADLAQAQQAKLDAICAKLELTRDSRLLDVGCGWGSAAIHAARDYGARVTAVTLAAGQARFTRGRVAELGLAGQVTVRVQDYRDIPAESYDAICSIEMGEHVGRAEYPAFCALLRDRLRPGGRPAPRDQAPGAAR
ncbi:MAG: SAM-dependent methyltransferase, partial [Streptosporangiaceae bacterium]